MLKKLSNVEEMRVYRQVEPTAIRYGASVYQKVRIADVVDIDKLTLGSMRSYALMAHYDFVVADEEQKPLFAVEFDGAGHSAEHDAKKDEICRRADLALFRVGIHASRLEAPQLTFLSYLVHLWFLAVEFRRLQEAGILADDEPFMISGFLRANAKNVFDSEFDLLGPAYGKFNNFCRKCEVPDGPMWHLRIAHVLLARDEDGFAAFSSFEVESEKLFGRCIIDLKLPHLGALGSVAFSRHEIGQFCTALAIDDLIEEMTFYRNAGHIVRRRDEVVAEIVIMKERGFLPLLGTGQDEDLQGA